jgi:excisionase family DNA binding protein
MLVTVVEAAERLNCSAENLRRLIRLERIPVFKVGPRTYRLDIDELLQFARREAKDPPEAA